MEEIRQEKDGLVADQDETTDLIDLEQYAQAGRRPPHAPRYRIRIDRRQAGIVGELPMVRGLKQVHIPPHRIIRRHYQPTAGLAEGPAAQDRRHGAVSISSRDNT